MLRCGRVPVEYGASFQKEIFGVGRGCGMSRQLRGDQSGAGSDLSAEHGGADARKRSQAPSTQP